MYIACTQHSWTLFGPGHNWEWEMDYLWKHYKEKDILWIRKSVLSTSKPKLSLCIWWGIRVSKHFELLEPNEKLNSERYCQELQHSNKRGRRCSITNITLLHNVHDNARPCAALGACQKVAELGWEILSHSPYSPDLASSCYHLFRFRGQQFKNGEDIRQATSTGTIFGLYR